MPLSLTSIVQRMIDKGRDLNSLAKGNGGLDWVTSQSLDENKSFTEETPEGKWFTYVVDISSKHLLYNTFLEGEEEKTTDGVENFTTVIKFFVKKNKVEKKTAKKEDEEDLKKDSEDNEEETDINDDADDDEDEEEDNLRNSSLRTPTGTEIDSKYPDASSSECYVFCNCPHFKYYYLRADRSITINGEDFARLDIPAWEDLDPRKGVARQRKKGKKKKKNPEKDLGICKHLVAAAHFLLETVDSKKQFGDDENSTLLTDINGKLTRLLNTYNDAYLSTHLPDYASNDQDVRDQYYSMHRLKLTRKRAEQAAELLVRNKNLKKEQELKNKTLVQQQKELKDKLAQGKSFKKIKGKKIPVGQEEDLLRYERIKSDLAHGRLAVKNYEKSIRRLSKMTNRFKLKLQHQKADNFRKAAHWWENETRRPPEEMRKEPSYEEIDYRNEKLELYKIKDIENYLHNLEWDKKWYTHFKNEDGNKEKLQYVKRQIKKWNKKLEAVRAKKKLTAIENNKEKSKGSLRGQSEQEKRTIVKSVISLKTVVDNAKNKTQDLFKKELRDIINNKDYDKTPINFEELDFIKDLKTRLNGIERLKTGYKNDLETRDLSKKDDNGRDRKKEFLDDLEKETKGRMSQYTDEIDSLKNIVDLINKAKKEGKEALQNDNTIKDLVKKVLKGGTANVTTGKKKEPKKAAPVKKDNNTPEEVDVPQETSKDKKKEVLDKIKDNRKKNQPEKAEDINDKKVDYYEKVKTIFNNMVSKVGNSFGKTGNQIEALALLKKLSDSMSNADLKDGKGFNFKTALKNNRNYKSLLLQAVQTATARPVNFIRDYFENESHSYDSFIR